MGVRLRLSREPVAPWMWRGEEHRAALSLPLSEGDEVTIRSRRPGDRLQPLGCAHRRRLKELLVDRKVPHQHRGRLPLLCLDGRIAWVPGVTIDHRFRLRSRATMAWVASLDEVAR